MVKEVALMDESEKRICYTALELMLDHSMINKGEYKRIKKAVKGDAPMTDIERINNGYGLPPIKRRPSGVRVWP